MRHCHATLNDRPWPRVAKPRVGQSLVELAVALPFFLTFCMGVADGGRAFFYHEAVSNGARQGLRVAAGDWQQATGDAACLGTGGTAVARSLSASLPAASTSPLATIANSVALESSANGTVQGSRIGGATLVVTWHCRNARAISNATNQGITDPANVGSDAIEVSLTYNFTLLTPLAARLFGGSTIALSTDVLGRAEY